MDKIEKITKAEAIILLMTIIANNIIFNISAIILNSAGTGAWLNIIYLSIISIIFIVIVTILFKSFNNADIIDVSEYLGGKFLKFITAILYIIFFVIFSSLALRYFSNSLQLIYFNYTPLIVLMLLFLIPVIIANHAGLKAIAGVTKIFFPFTFLGVVILMFVASKDFVWQHLFPIFGFGIDSVFFSGINNLFAFNVIAYIFLLKPLLKQEKDFKTISIVSVIICGIYILMSIVSLLMSFPFIIETDEMFAVYLLTRIVSFGEFLQRVDAVFILLWILVFLSFLSFNFYCILKILKKILKFENVTELHYSLALIILGIALSFKDIITVKFILRNYFRIYSVILIFAISFIILLFAYFKKKLIHGKEIMKK